MRGAAFTFAKRSRSQCIACSNVPAFRQSLIAPVNRSIDLIHSQGAPSSAIHSAHFLP